jgi:hypothetical protein
MRECERKKVALRGKPLQKPLFVTTFEWKSNKAFKTIGCIERGVWTQQVVFFAAPSDSWRRESLGFLGVGAHGFKGRQEGWFSR